MIDIHHHLLPGLDDGASDLQTSLAMVEMAIADGITHIACTPHASHHYYFDPEMNATVFAELQDAVQKNFGEDRITLGLGCDFHLMFDNIEDAQRHPTRYTINGHNYLLVEFPDSAISPNTPQTFYQLSLSGMTPIITHPERNLVLARQPERMWEWLQAGALIQVTASSLSGRFGPMAERAALWLLDHQWVHFLATDAHNTQSRPPLMRPAFDLLTELYGLSAAERMCIRNPHAAFYGEALDPQPEAAPPNTVESRHRPAPSRTSFFGRLFKR
ncbi:MAG TPA: CpsB/CapC family capsule biosynthesis tyrosine phosphatase [Acidobacteriaceae bacterium]|jgi:protein-tyrosine phosphatase